MVFIFNHIRKSDGVMKNWGFIVSKVLFIVQNACYGICVLRINQGFVAIGSCLEIVNTDG